MASGAPSGYFGVMTPEVNKMEGSKHVDDDVIEYYLYVNYDLVYADDKNYEEKTEELLDKYLAYVSHYLVEYIWHRDPFNLRVVTKAGDIPAYLHGKTNFGDNIEDEWFIVYLLFQITRAYPEVAVKVNDTDGEFLLIEAAEYLPKWLDPQTSVNRVFLQNGDVHIIPIPNSPADVTILPAGTPNLQIALQTLRHVPDRTRASPQIQDCVKKRIKGYPGKIQEYFHHSNCYIPANVATVLHEKPALISPAVQAFYSRDALDLKACRSMKYFPPQHRIMRRVKFTRCLYGQLIQQRFQPVKSSNWAMPSQSNRNFKAWDLGMKLAYGFEILCARCQQTPSDSDSETAEKTEVNEVRWQGYVKCLKDRDYFRGELEGSKLYRQLLKSAKEYYQQIMVQSDQVESADPGHQVLQILKTTEVDLDKLKKEEKTLPPEDDDKWMYLSPDELDEMLYEATGRRNTPSQPKSAEETDLSHEMNFDSESITSGMKDFVNKVSSHEGAEFPWMSDNSKISFNPEAFLQAVEKMMNVGFRGTKKDDHDEDSDFLDEDDEIEEQESDGDDDDDDDDDEEAGDGSMKAVMEQMDRELAQTNIGKSFEKLPAQSDVDTKPGDGKSEETASAAEDDEDTRPVDIDMNLLKNVLESYRSQEGLAGPASNILQSMGITIPHDMDDLD
ncbi:protein ecdysoneless homolog [Ptychodera flava]|uniref:protein ecdysoneless homolog n=1 Tax=Ptychodera flava TaxID=63121 RepID=UPI00396A94AC